MSHLLYDPRTTLCPIYYYTICPIYYSMFRLLLYVPFTTLCPIYLLQLEDDMDWAVIKPHVFSTVMDFFASGLPVLTDEQPSPDTCMYKRCSIYIEIFIFIAIHFHVFPVQDHFGSMTFDDCQERKKYFLNACSVA